MSRYTKHIFVCTNKREPADPRGCCFNKNSSEVLDELKKRLKELGLSSKIRANSSGCLDACSFGPSIVVYPEQVWYGAVNKDDVEEIIQDHLIGNKPVERLLIKSQKFRTDEK